MSAVARESTLESRHSGVGEQGVRRENINFVFMGHA